MKYTIDSPNLAFEAFVKPLEHYGPLQKWTIGLLLKLPNADPETTQQFVEYGRQQWGKHQPSFAVISKENGALVIPWNGEPVDIHDKDHLEWLACGELKHSKVVGEIGAIHSTMYIEMSRVMQ